MRHTHSAAGARIPIGHVRGALLVPHQHMVDAVLRHGVICRQNGSAGIAEDLLDPQAFEAFPDNFRAALDQDLSPSVVTWPAVIQAIRRNGSR